MKAGRSELLDMLRALVQSCGHASANPACAFNTKGCNCGAVERQKIALADANRVLREEK